MLGAFCVQGDGSVFDVGCCIFAVRNYMSIVWWHALVVGCHALSVVCYILVDGYVDEPWGVVD